MQVFQFVVLQLERKIRAVTDLKGNTLLNKRESNTFSLYLQHLKTCFFFHKTIYEKIGRMFKVGGFKHIEILRKS